MLVFIAILYLILVAITPFVAFYLLGKYKKLRAEFDQSKEEQAQQRKSLQREIADLKEQLASAVPGQSAGPERPVEPVTPAAAPTREGPLPPSRVEFPGPVEIPPPAAISPQKPVMPPTPRAPSVPSTEVPARAKTLAEVKPSVPATTPTPKIPLPTAPVVTPPSAKPPTPPAQAQSPWPAAPFLSRRGDSPYRRNLLREEGSLPAYRPWRNWRRLGAAFLQHLRHLPRRRDANLPARPRLAHCGLRAHAVCCGRYGAPDAALSLAIRHRPRVPPWLLHREPEREQRLQPERWSLFGYRPGVHRPENGLVRTGSVRHPLHLSHASLLALSPPRRERRAGQCFS